MSKAKVLVLDIETSYLTVKTWGVNDQFIPIENIQEDWFILAFSAKWLGDPPSKIIYMDQRNSKDIGDDSKLLKKLWELLDEAQVTLTQNGVKFDLRKINSRFILNGMNPPSGYKNIDTLKIARKHFGFTSNKLAYMTSKLCKKYKKLDHKKFPGISLWTECMKGNKAAWKEMEKYNKWDILSLEELYGKLVAWDNSINLSVFDDKITNVCNCGSKNIKPYKGYAYSNVGKFARYRCEDCGKGLKGKVNLFSKEKRASLRSGT
jgi:DNA polymerase elongation subunit (family B)